MKQKIIYLSSFLFLLIVVAFALLFVKKSLPPNKQVQVSNSLDEKSQVSNQELKVSGSLYLSASLDKQILPEPYIVNTDEKKIVQEGLDDNSVGFFHSINLKDNNVTFVGTKKTELMSAVKDKVSIGKAFQIYLGKITPEGKLPLVVNSEKLTNNDQLVKRNPVLSPDSKNILYVTYQDVKTKKDARSLEGFNTHILNVESKTEKILATANIPIWTDSNSFIYLAKDGIRKNFLNSSSSALIFQFPVTNNMKLSISNNGKIVALNIPDAKKVFLFDLSLDTLKPLGEISVLGYWTTFSPDDNILAVQSVQNPDDKKSKPNLLFYSLKDLKQIGDEVKLDLFDNDKLFLTSWK